VNPKRILIIVLCLVAIVVWGRNAFLLVNGAPESNLAAKTTVFSDDYLTAQPYAFKADFRDPFFCKYFMNENEHAIVRRKGKAGPPVKLPSCTIDGIMYNGTNSYVLMHVGGKSAVARQGDIVDSIQIRKIGKDSVFALYKGKTFAIGK